MMNRQKLLVVVAGSILALVVVYTLISSIYLKPSRELDQRITALRNDIARFSRENDREVQYLRTLRRLGDASYGSDPTQVSNLAQRRLQSMLEQSGLPVALAPIDNKLVNGTSSRGYRGDFTVGWAITTRGPVDRIFEFLYLVQADPYLNRIEGLTLTPDARSRDYHLRARYITLVLPDQRPQETPGTVELASLATDERQKAWQLVERDIFRPFVRRPAPRPDPPPQQPQQPQAQPQQPAAPPPARPVHRITGLTKAPDGYVINLTTTSATERRTRSFKVGDRLVGGEIVMVDVRWLPDPKRPHVNSPSRVIIRISDAYWAIELGHSLDDRYRMEPPRLPEALRESRAEGAGGESGRPDEAS